PPLLTLECGPGDQPVECSVCFDPLHVNPAVFVGDAGYRVCGHFMCLNCAEHVLDEASDRMRAWRARRDPRIHKPQGPVCPLCRAPFSSAVRLTDPTVDPRSFFHLACVPEDRTGGGGGDPDAERSPETLALTERHAMGALTALLP
ncbi:unnamed protein product, partial [Polarella glacialis]